MRKTFKKFFRAAALMAMCALAPDVSAQQPQPCNLIIRSDFESQCLLPEEKYDYYNEEPGSVVACQGNVVTYQAYANTGTAHVTQWEWNVVGGTMTTSGNTAIVTWGMGTQGQLSVTVVTDSGTTCTLAKSVRLMEKPTVSVVTTPAYVETSNGGKIIYVCKGETVEFTDLSSTTNTDIAGYYWESGVYGLVASTSGFRIENVDRDERRIIHRVYNNCGCYDEEVYSIRVMEGDILDVDCYGTLCQDAIATYSAITPRCGRYSWYVEGGTILDGQNQPKVTVRWDNPQNGSGILSLDGSLCGQNACPAMLTKKIPIIQDSLAIEGQSVACVDEAVVYSIPLYGSTEYHWDIQPAGMANVHEVNGANQKMIEFHRPGTYRLTVSYRCDFLECGEFTSAPLTVTVKPKLSITGEDRICVSNHCQLSTEPTVSARWTVYDLNNSNHVVAYYPSLTQLTTQFPHAGRYLVTAEDGNYCRRAEFVITVQDAPPAPTVLDIDTNNPRVACLHDAVRLQAHPRNPNYTIVWTPSCSDATPSQISGNDVTIEFDDTICNVLAYTYDRILKCKSATPYVQQIDELVPGQITIPRYDSICPGGYIVWGDDSVPPQDYVLYEWTIQNNKQHCASIQGSNLKNSVVLAVHELASGNYPDDFYVVLKRRVCHVDYYDTFHIHINGHIPANISVSAQPLNNCPNQPFTFTGTGGDPTGYRWKVDGLLVPFVGNPYTCSFSTPGTHIVTMLYSETDNCTNLDYFDSATVSVSVYQAPVITDILYDRDNQTVCVDMVPGTYTYQWYYNMALGATSDCTPYVGEGSYHCVVTDTNGCTSTGTKDIGPDTPVPCEVIDWRSVDYNFCTAELSLLSRLTPPDILWNCSGRNDDRSLRVDNNNKRHATIKFKNVGTYHIQTSSFSSSPCKASKYTKVVKFIPNITLEKKCDRIVVHNNCRSLTGTETLHFDVAGHRSFDMPFSQKRRDYPVTTNGIYTFDMRVVVDGETYHCTYSVVFTTINNSTLTITSANTGNPDKTCNNTPIELIATLSPAAPISSTRWTFGDGAVFTGTGNHISHTFDAYSNQHIYSVTATVTDANGCPVTSQPFSITSYANNITDYNLAAPGTTLCPGTPRNIQFGTSPNILNSGTFYWNESTTPSSNYRYPTYNTGIYPGIAVDIYYCHVQDNINVKFKAKPTAIIVTEKQKYCVGEKIVLYGATGPDSNSCTYLWTITNLNNNTVTQFSTATAIFTPPTAGNYDIELDITHNISHCSDHASGVTLTVYNVPPRPTIGFGSNKCMDHPPVELVGSTSVTSDIHWSNGAVGTYADYYTAGMATAWYYDPISGCKSQEEAIHIEPAPDFDALLTGCFEKCPDFFRNNRSLPVWGLSSGREPIDYRWFFGGGGLDGGSLYYDNYFLSLPLQGYGDYNLHLSYGGGNCGYVKSPTLTIRKKKECDCEGLDVSYKYKMKIKNCELIYDVTVTVCNNSNVKTCVNKLEMLSGRREIKLDRTDFHDQNLLPGECYTFQMTIVATQFVPSAVASFSIYSNCGKCSTEFAIDLMPQNFECEDGMHIDPPTIHPILTNAAAGYFDLSARVNHTQNVLAFWSEPPMVLEYRYDGNSAIRSLCMVDMALLSQLVQQHQEFCFYAITCESDRLCKRKFCMKAEELYNSLLAAMSQRTSMTSPGGEEEYAPLPSTESSTPYLMPNPTTGQVEVAGTADPVVEVLVLDMSGRRMATFESTAFFDISSLPSGTYIVRVITKSGDDTPEEINYLKLVKN